jgi:hypothetical protein
MLFLFRGRQVVFELFKCGNSNFCFFPHIFCYYVGAIFKAPRKILSAILSSISGNDVPLANYRSYNWINNNLYSR